MDKIIVRTPLDQATCQKLRSGDRVLITGKIYTARDAAHLKLVKMMEAGVPLPFDIKGQVIYYAGPSPARPGMVIGACGPTTSYRMDDLTKPLLEKGLLGMIGKGDRSDEVIEDIKAFGAVYFAAVGGAGALIASSIANSEVVAFDELGPEAIRCLEVVDFPAIVVIDSKGNDLYKEEPEKYKIKEGDMK